MSDMNEENPEQLPTEVGVLALRNAVLFPEMAMPLSVGRPRSVALVDEASEGSGVIAVVSQRDPETEDPSVEELYEYGTLCRILKVLRLAKDNLNVIVQGIQRIRVEEIVAVEPYLLADVTHLDETESGSVEVAALARNVVSQFEKYVRLSPSLTGEVAEFVRRLQDHGRIADAVGYHLDIGVDDKMKILQCLDVKERLEEVTMLLAKEIEVLKLGSKIQSQVMNEVGKSQREYYLREQMKAIQRELGEGEEQPETEELRQAIEAAGMPEDAHAAAERELNRLERMHPSSSEYSVARTYLDWLTHLPWSVETTDLIDIPAARKVLDDDHYDLDEVKERILEFLAVKKVKEEMKGPILCLIGPPGVGKTSLGRSIARALGRKFVRMSLGGMRDEAEIRGHRRTYVGALPGRIVQGMRNAGSCNPLFMLDEIDKVGLDFRGDPTSALLEVLDPEQNHSFSDHYLEVPFDLSKVLFIATGNLVDPVPAALRDRMEILRLPGYTHEEKLEIARRHLIPKQLEEHGLTAEQIEIPDETLAVVASDYTREAGVRNLEREIARICRKVVRKRVEEELPEEHRDVVEPKDLQELLGPMRHYSEVAERIDRPGVCTGLAWTPSGGDILFIEASRMPGKGELMLTGQLGDVMKESARAALTYIRSEGKRWGLPAGEIGEADIHVHVPAGATPKDGPSAGLPLAVALFSLLSGRVVEHEVALTGEVTLRGKVLPVGGIKEKVLAAKRSGIKAVVLPRKNEPDLIEMQDQHKEGLTFHLVEEIEEALVVAFDDEGLRSSPEAPPPVPPAGEAPPPSA
jgi:ATP-dependent Lon protease